jgi:hypothetical protein
MDFAEAMRRQNARDQRSDQNAASAEASRQCHAEGRILEVQKGFHDLAQFLVQNGAPKFQFSSSRKGVRLRDKLKVDTTPSPVGFVVDMSVDRDRLDGLTLLLPDSKLWRFENSGRLEVPDKREYLEVSPRTIGVRGAGALTILSHYITWDADGTLVAEYAGYEHEQTPFAEWLAGLAKSILTRERLPQLSYWNAHQVR